NPGPGPTLRLGHLLTLLRLKPRVARRAADEAFGENTNDETDLKISRESIPRNQGARCMDWTPNLLNSQNSGTHLIVWIGCVMRRANPQAPMLAGGYGGVGERLAAVGTVIRSGSTMMSSSV